MEETVVQSFRTAVGGFHKGDVMNYISDTAAKHEKELKEKDRYIAELTAENQELKDRIDTLNASFTQMCLAPKKEEPVPVPEPLPEPVQQPVTVNLNEQELAAYRRAEQVERFANVRAKKQYQELAEFTETVENTYGESEIQVQQVLESLNEQILALRQIQEKLTSTAAACREREQAIENPDAMID